VKSAYPCEATKSHCGDRLALAVSLPNTQSWMIYCRTCGEALERQRELTSPPYLGTRISANGIRSVRWFRNHRNAQGAEFVIDLHGARYDEWDPQNPPPVVFDFEVACADRCDACGQIGDVELHHWAPRAIFGVLSDAWPTSLLCVECHRKWHVVMTPNEGKEARQRRSKRFATAFGYDQAFVGLDEVGQ
jgi:hypothetical protein